MLRARCNLGRQGIHNLGVACLLVLSAGGCHNPSDREIRAPETAAAGACKTSPGDDSCDLCTAAKCCPEETACMGEVACKSADDVLDACEAKAEKAGHGLPDCHGAFAATGPTAKRRTACITSRCSAECVGTTASVPP